eukprot:1546275-Pyramimonas_sp.AAC.1
MWAWQRSAFNRWRGEPFGVRRGRRRRQERAATQQNLAKLVWRSFVHLEGGGRMMGHASGIALSA